jgi:hypothetical protein
MLGGESECCDLGLHLRTQPGRPGLEHDFDDRAGMIYPNQPRPTLSAQLMHVNNGRAAADLSRRPPGNRRRCYFSWYQVFATQVYVPSSTIGRSNSPVILPPGVISKPSPLVERRSSNLPFR